MKKRRRIMIIILLGILSIQIGNHVSKDKLDYNESSRLYFVEKGYEETSSLNLVTAIYLDYRLFDSFFEAGILLVSVTGIAFMTIKDEDLL